MRDVSQSSEGVFADLLDLVPLDESETQTPGQRLLKNKTAHISHAEG